MDTGLRRYDGEIDFESLQEFLINDANQAAVHAQALPLFGINFSATPLLHQRLPVGRGPSVKTWP